jgi:hypothetical protein
MDYKQSLRTWSDNELIRVYRLGTVIRWIFINTSKDADSFDYCQHERFNEIVRRNLEGIQ